MITEKDALLAIPSQGFVNDYCTFAVQQTTAPLGYHLACALALLSVTTPQNFGTSYAGDLYGNLYTLLVGRSGDDQKSSALGISKKVLYAVDAQLTAGQKLIGKQPGSTEGMIDSLVVQPRQIIYYSEFGAFLSKAQKKGSYFEPMKSLYTDLWDCLDDQTEILTKDGWKGKGEVKAGDIIIAYDTKNDTLVSTKALDYGERPVREGEKMVCFSSRYVNFRVTEGHRIYHKTMAASSSYIATTALEYAQYQQERRIPLSAKGLAGQINEETCFLQSWELVLFLYYMVFGEKCCRPSSNFQTKSLDFRFSTAAASDRFFKFLQSIGVTSDSYSLTGDTRVSGGGAQKTYCRISLDKSGPFSDPERIAALCADPQAFPEVLKRLSFAEFLMCCDKLSDFTGLRDPIKEIGNFFCSEAQARGFSALASLYGYHSTANKGNGKATHRLRITTTKHHLMKPALSKDISITESIPGEIVWCVTNTYGTLVTRRQGKVVILGNCQPVDRMKANNVEISQPNPRLSLAAGVSLTFLEEHTDPHDWTGGFMGRWAVIYGRRERTVSYPRNDWSAVPALAAFLLQRSQVQQVGPCFGLSQAAYEKWDDWYHELDRRPMPEIISGAKTRAPTIAMKAALLYAWDFGDPLSGEPWFIQPHHLDWGFRFAELHLKSVVGLSSFMAEHADAHLRRSILETIPLGGVKSLGQILRSSKMKKRTVLDVLDGLVVDGTLRHHPLIGAAGEALYERVVSPNG